MNRFLKYFGVAFAVQAAVCVLVGILVSLFSPGLDQLSIILLVIYAPTMFLISSVADLRGSSAMVYPILVGIPLGILIYSIIVGILLTRFRR